LQPGDLVKATASFTVSNSSGPCAGRSRTPLAPAEIDLTGVKIVYTGTQQVNAVWLNNASNLYIFGGDISTSDTGGVCLRVYGSQHVLWWGFNLHDCGATGFQAQAIGGPVDHDDFQGTIWKVGKNLAWDPHAEKGTGLHAANLWDANQTNAFTNNRFAFYAHDIPVGACVEYGNNQGVATGNVLYLKCVNETMVAQTQTGGNASNSGATSTTRPRPPWTSSTSKATTSRASPTATAVCRLGLTLPGSQSGTAAPRTRTRTQVRRPEPLGLERRRGLQGASASSVID
jgi:hypothetical protein